MVEQIKERIEYIFRREALAKCLDIAYLICFAVYIWIRGINYSTIYNILPDHFVAGYRFAIICVVFLRFLLHNGEEEQRKDWTRAIVVGTLLGVLWTLNSSTVYVDLAILLVGAVGISYKSLLKIYVTCMSALVLVFFMGSMVGIGTDVISLNIMSRELPYQMVQEIEDYQSATYYHSLGFANGEILARALFDIVLALWVLVRDIEGFYFSGLFVVSGVLSFLFTGDLRALLLSFLAAVLSAVIYVLNTRKFWKTKESMEIRKKLIMGIRCFAMACPLSYFAVALLIFLCGGERYLPALFTKGMGPLFLFVVHFILYRRARAAKNGILMIAVGLPLFYALATSFLADPFLDVYVLLLFCDLTPQKKEMEEAATPGRVQRRKMFNIIGILGGGAVLGLALLLLFVNLPKIRTTVSFLDAREHLFCSMLVLTGYALLVLAIAKIVHMLLGNLGRRNERLVVQLMTLVAMVGIFFVVQILPSVAVKKVPKDYQDALEQETEILSSLAKLCDDTGVVMYVSDVPDLYKKEFDYVSDSVMLSNYLAKKENVIFVTRCDEYYQELINAGYYHTLISDEHAIYSNSEWAWQLLEGDGYVKANCFSGKNTISVQWMAWKNDITYKEEEGALILGSDECMWWGPDVYWPAGVYKVDVKIKWIGGTVVESAGARLAIGNSYTGDSSGEVIYHGNEIRNQEETVLTTIFAQTTPSSRDIQVNAYDDVKFWVEEITWQQLWQTTAEDYEQ